MPVNNHLNGSWLCGDWKTGGEEKASGGCSASQCKQSRFQCLSGGEEGGEGGGGNVLICTPLGGRGLPSAPSERADAADQRVEGGGVSEVRRELPDKHAHRWNRDTDMWAGRWAPGGQPPPLQSSLRCRREGLVALLSQGNTCLCWGGGASHKPGPPEPKPQLFADQHQLMRWTTPRPWGVLLDHPHPPTTTCHSEEGGGGQWQVGHLDPETP